MWAEILVVVALILLNGVFAMSELALVSSRPAELRRLADKGSKGARVALDMIADPSRLLSTVQIGITLVGIVAGAYSGATLGSKLAVWFDANFTFFGSWSEEVAMTIVISIITYLSLVIGELVPKRLAMNHSEAIAVRVAPLMRWIAMGGGPLVALLRVSTNSILVLMGQKPNDSKSVTEEELKAVIAEGALAGVIEPAEKDMLDRVMRLADRPVGSIMTPRPDVEWLDLEHIDQWREMIGNSRHSRFPVGRGSLEEMAGILETRKLLDAWLQGQEFDPLSAIIEAPAVHEGTPAPRLLEMLRSSGKPMAIVMDEYGGVEGVVTLTDVLEAIAGTLPHPDEDDHNSLIQRADGSWLLDGLMAIDEVEAGLNLDGMKDEGDFHTLAGFVLSQMARLPQVGESFEWNGWRFEVIDLDGRRIDKVLATPPPKLDQAEE